MPVAFFFFFRNPMPFGRRNLIWTASQANGPTFVGRGGRAQKLGCTRVRRKLGRTSSHRKALLKNLTIALIESEKIETTLPKAKELRSYVEKLVTKSRNADFNTHRYVFAELQSKEATKKLINEIAPKYEAKGGYTRIVKLVSRKGDGAEMAIIELI